jgi:hypothetical protein
MAGPAARVPCDQRASLLLHAKKCRDMARTTMDVRSASTLRGMAQEYEKQAGQMPPAE